jgi:hypothetical protein|tara:strand:+ start:1807 stop:2190 length:384 start_codon:yes stop_codon:yes gene_type:complete
MGSFLNEDSLLYKFSRVVESVKELEKSGFNLALKVYEDSVFKVEFGVVKVELLRLVDKKFILLVKLELIVRLVLELSLSNKVLSTKFILLSEDSVFCKKNKFSLVLVLLEDNVFTGKFVLTCLKLGV